MSLIKGNHEECKDCPISAACAGTSTLIVQLVHDGTNFGYLMAILGHDLEVDDKEIGLFSEMAVDIGYALNFIRIEAEHEASERKGRLLQNQLAQAQKMESVGRLAGGVAHEYNTMPSRCRRFQCPFAVFLAAHPPRVHIRQRTFKPVSDPSDIRV